MAKFFKNLFSSSTLRIKEDDVAKNIAKSNKDITNNKDNTSDKDNTTKEVPSYDTQKKMSISRSGRMKQNAKLRGKLNDELYGKEGNRNSVTALEYRVNKFDFYEDEPKNVPIKSTNLLTQKELDNADLKKKSDALETRTEPKKKHSMNNGDNQMNYNDDESDTDSVSLSKFDKDIEQIMQYRESNF